MRPGVGRDQIPPVGGDRHRPSHPEVVEGLLVELHPRHVHRRQDELRGLETGLALPRDVEVEAAEDHRVLGAEVVPAREERGEARGRIALDGDLDAVRVRQARQEVLGVPREGHADAGLVALQHPGPGAHAGLCLFQIAVGLDRLARDDEHRGRGEHVEEPGERLLEREADRVPIEHLDLLQRVEEAPGGVPRDREEALVAVLHVVGRQLAPVHRRPRVPPDPAPEPEDVGRVAGLAPRLREVGLERRRARAHRRARLHPDQPAVGHGEDRQAAVGECLLGIEALRLEAGDAKDPAPPRGLGRHGPGREEVARRPDGDRRPPQLQHVSTADRHPEVLSSARPRGAGPAADCTPGPGRRGRPVGPPRLDGGARYTGRR